MYIHTRTHLLTLLTLIPTYSPYPRYSPYSRYYLTYSTSHAATNLNRLIILHYHIYYNIAIFWY
jgi:hypothetical protein